MTWTLEVVGCDVNLRTDVPADADGLPAIEGSLDCLDGTTYPIVAKADSENPTQFKAPLPTPLLNGSKMEVVFRSASPVIQANFVICPTDELNNDLGTTGPAYVDLAGAVTYFDGEIVRGWAYDKARRNERLNIEIFVNNQRISTVTADERRAGLATRGLNDGRCGFSKMLPSTVLVGRNVLAIRVAGAEAVIDGGVIEVDPSAIKRFVIKEITSRIARLEKLFA